MLSAFLEDSYTGTITPISIVSPSSYDFIVNSEIASYAVNRFRIVFKAAGSGPLPVSYSNIKAWQQGSNIAVEWTVENEVNISKYEVGKSRDGVNFGEVNTTVAAGANRNSITYNWLDQNVVPGDNYYRISSIDRNGKIGYSRIVKVKMSITVPGISIYPNPVTNGIISMEFSNMAAGVYRAKLFNNIGQTILTKMISHSTGTSSETISPDYPLLSGMYQLEIAGPGKKIAMIKLIIQ